MVFVAPQRILNAKRTLIERKVNAMRTQSERNCGWTDFFHSGVLFVTPLSKRFIITKWSDNYHSSGVPGDLKRKHAAMPVNANLTLRAPPLARRLAFVPSLLRLYNYTDFFQCRRIME